MSDHGLGDGEKVSRCDKRMGGRTDGITIAHTALNRLRHTVKNSSVCLQTPPPGYSVHLNGM